MVREAARSCTACDLYENATQTVFGEGPAHAPIMLVGEQPGSQEDLEGRPFVGPSGKLLDEVLDEVGLSREDAYVTNAVKHFKFTLRGKRRIHEKPNTGEIHACNGWLMAEVDRVKPQIIVCLGATAAQAFFGSTFRLTRSRGQLFETPWAPFLLATYHPSALLRMPDEAARRTARELFAQDLSIVSEHLKMLRTAPVRRLSPSDSLPSMY